MTLKTRIAHEGQPFVDEPVFVKPKRISRIEASVAFAFKRRLPEPIQVGHERVWLRWLKPDGSGGLRPMNKTASVLQPCH